jgi:hypothetical protein
LIKNICSLLDNFRPFHIIIEAFNTFIDFSIFIIAINSYEISENIPFLFLGIAFGFAGGFNIIHIIASKEVDKFIIFNDNYEKINIEFSDINTKE